MLLPSPTRLFYPISQPLQTLQQNRRRFAKKQQMQWSKKGAHRLLQTRTKTLDGTLPDLFAQWYPAMTSNDNQVPVIAVAA